ncbi:hypothetical protein RUND412_007795 [Rhizina undulata]
MAARTAPSRPTTLPTPIATPSPPPEKTLPPNLPIAAGLISVASPTTRFTTPESPGCASGFSRSCPQRPPPPAPKPSFDTLPPSIQTMIFRLILDDPSLAASPDMFVIDREPRYANPNILAIMERKPIVAQLRQVSRLSYSTANESLYSPAFVTSMKQLAVLASARYGDADVKRKRRHDDIRPMKWRRVQGERLKDKWGHDRTVKQLVLMMYEQSPEQPKLFPWWYVADHMRYDLEVLKVEKLIVVAPTREQIKAVLCAVIPNHETIRHLHIELTANGRHYPPFPEFYKQYLHDSPDTQHLCPYLLQLSPTLESLTLRNITFCDHLFPEGAWPKLHSFQSNSVNGLPGLCRSRDPPRNTFQEAQDLEIALHRHFLSNATRTGEVWLSVDEYNVVYNYWQPLPICLVRRQFPHDLIEGNREFDRLSFGTIGYEIDNSRCFWRDQYPEGSGGMWEKEWGGFRVEETRVVSESDYEDEVDDEIEWDTGMFDVQEQERRFEEAQKDLAVKGEVRRPLRIR